MRLSRLCLETELACKDDRIEDARALGSRLQSTLDEAEQALSAWDGGSRQIGKAAPKALSQVTHDLRGNLNRVLGAVINLEEIVDVPSQAGGFEEHAATILRESQQMANLVDGMAELITAPSAESGAEHPASVPDPEEGTALLRPNSVLLVEDDVMLARSIGSYLNKMGFDAVLAETGAEMFEKIDSRNFDGYVVDLTLPDEDGLVLIRKLRARTDAPIIVQTGRGDLDDKLAAFELGADEYVTKPVDPRELTIRLKVLLKRSAEALGVSEDELRYGDYVLDHRRHLARTEDGETITFTSNEFALLWALTQADGKILSRDVLVDAVAKGEGPESFRAVDTLVSRVRKKLRKQAIVTVPKAGYKSGWPVKKA